MLIILTLAIVFVTLAINELWWRIKKPNDEISRKAVHILIGCYVAFWPTYLGWTTIEVIGLAFCIGVYISKHFGVLHSIHAVQRPTWGEMFFGLSVGLLPFITHDQLVYTTALLTMGLADGLAAIFGSYFGKSTNYSIFGATKSVVGSLTFLIVAVGILAVYRSHLSQAAPPIDYVFLAIAAMVIENCSVWGLDNLFVPLLITIWLR